MSTVSKTHMIKCTLHAKMDDKNKKLALKNLQLKTEIDKLTECQTSLMRENIKVTYYSNRAHRKMAEILDENLACIERAYNNMLRFRREILGDTGADCRMLQSKALTCESEKAEDSSEAKAEPKPLSDKSNVARQRRKCAKVFNKKPRGASRRKK